MGSEFNNSEQLGCIQIFPAISSRSALVSPPTSSGLATLTSSRSTPAATKLLCRLSPSTCLPPIIFFCSSPYLHLYEPVPLLPLPGTCSPVAGYTSTTAPPPSSSSSSSSFSSPLQLQFSSLLDQLLPHLRVFLVLGQAD